jgi:hypothetical protein
MINKKFGFLTVTSYAETDKRRNKVWICRCDCGSITKATTQKLQSGRKTSCGCKQHKKGKESPFFKGFEDITGSKWYIIKRGAQIRNLSFNITPEYVWHIFETQNKKCVLSGLPLSFIDGSASVDRIDNKIGYEVGNIQIVHTDINAMRSDYTVDYFIEICQQVTKNINK